MEIFNYDLKDWSDYITGIVLMEDENWVLLHELPGDYQPDGYCLVNKSQIVDRFKDEDSELKERVLQLKGYQMKLPEKLVLGNVDDMLRTIEKQYHVFGIQDEEDTIRVGTIQSIVANELRLNFINTFGEMSEETPEPIFKTDIQTITFGTDYLHSIYLLWKDQSKK